MSGSYAVNRDDVWTPTRYEAMRMALEAAQASPDPSTQIGGVLYSRTGEVLHSDCNRMPLGVSDYHPDKSTRWASPLKYSLVSHCEVNTILGAARKGFSVDKTTLVCTHAACDRCATTIIESGVETMVRIKWPEEHAGWSEPIWVADIMLMEAGVEVIDLSPSNWGIPVRRSGRTVTP